MPFVVRAAFSAHGIDEHSARRVRGFCHSIFGWHHYLSASPEEHLSHIRTVFDRLREHGLKIKLKKMCVFLFVCLLLFFRTETKYLGSVIHGKGIKPDQER